MTAVVVIALSVGAYLFQPWLIFVDTVVDDEIPVAVTAPSPGAPVPPGQPVLLSTGKFISHEHDTSGSASIIERPDGTRILAIADLDTTTGPDVHVYLSDGAVVGGVGGWRKAANADNVDLGEIKGNKGNQVYMIPADVDLAKYPAVFLWCVRFSVSFGAASLEPA